MEEAHSHCCVPALVDSRRRPRRAGVVSILLIELLCNLMFLR